LSHPVICKNAGNKFSVLLLKANVVQVELERNFVSKFIRDYSST